MEKAIHDLLSTRQLTVDRSGFQCGVGSILSPSEYSNAVQSHNFVISWILRGEGTYSEAGNVWDLRDFSVCMRRPDREHSLSLHPQNGLRLFLSIPQDTYPALLRMIPELENLPPVWTSPYESNRVEEFVSLYDHMLQISSLDLYTLLPKMIRYILHLTGIHQSREREPLSIGRRMLEENWILPLEEIAERCGMKYNTFRKHFTEAYGVSPGQYRIRRRVEEGCRLLACGSSVTDTAALLGYADVYSFTHQFSAVMGMPPGRYCTVSQLPRESVDSSVLPSE